MKTWLRWPNGFRTVAFVGLLVEILAGLVERDIVFAATTDGCGQLLDRPLAEKLDAMITYGFWSVVFIVILAFFLSKRSYFHLPVILLWTAISLYYLTQYYIYFDQIGGDCTFALPRSLASVLMFGRFAIAGALIVLAWPPFRRSRT